MILASYPYLHPYLGVTLRFLLLEKQSIISPVEACFMMIERNEDDDVEPVQTGT